MKTKKVLLFLIILIPLLVIIIIKNLDKKAEVIVEDKQEEKEDMFYVYLSGSFLINGKVIAFEGWTIRDLIKNYKLKEDADLSDVDLDVVIEEGERIYIPKISDEKKVEDSSLININTASLEILVTLPGIGTYLANKIIEYRKAHVFKIIEDIKNVDGIKDEKFNQIKAYITV